MLNQLDESLAVLVLKALFGSSFYDCDCQVCSQIKMEGNTKTGENKESQALKGKMCLAKSMLNDFDRLVPPKDDLLLYATKVVEEYRNMMKHGNAELGVEIQEPYISPDFVHSENHMLVSFSIHLSKIILNGLSNYKVERIHVERERRTSYMEIMFDIISGKGVGKMEASVLGFPWTQCSNFDISVFNCRVVFTCKWSPQEDGTISIDDIEVTSTEENIDLSLNIILGSNKLVSKVFNTKRVYNSYRPVLENAFRLNLLKIMREYGRRFPELLAQWKTEASLSVN